MKKVLIFLIILFGLVGVGFGLSKINFFPKVLYDGSRTGKIVEYTEYCTGGKTMILENEQMWYSDKEGIKHLWTSGDIACYKAKLARETVTPTPTIKIVKSNPNPTITTSNEPQAPPPINGGNVFGLINSYRSSRGLPTWSVSDQLCILAENRASYLIGNNVDFFRNTIGANLFSHPGFRDQVVAGYDAGWLTSTDVSENLYKDARVDADVLRGWQNSPNHNGLLLTTTLAKGEATKACIATRTKYYGSITVLEVGDK